MGDFNHGHIKWDTLQSTGVEDQQLLCLIQDNFLTQHVLEPTRAERVLDIVLSSQKEFVDNVVIQEPLGSSDHNQLHFNIKIKSDKKVSEHCRIAASKGNQVLGMIRRNITYKEKSLIVPLYKATVRPHLEYCIILYRHGIHISGNT